MVLFTKQNCTLKCHDQYYTPASAFEAIAHLIPRGVTIWEPFWGDGTSGATLRSMGWEVIHREEDFFSCGKLGDIVVTNPPFSASARVLGRLKDLDIPFLCILPAWKQHASYCRDLFSGGGLQIVIPRKRIHFQKIRDGVVVPLPKGHRGTSFECFYVCYKLAE